MIAIHPKLIKGSPETIVNGDKEAIILQGPCLVEREREREKWWTDAGEEFHNLPNDSNFFLIFLKLEGFKIGQGYSYQTQQEKGLPRPSSPRLTIVPYTALVVLRKLIPLSAVYGCSLLDPPNLTNQDLKLKKTTALDLYQRPRYCC